MVRKMLEATTFCAWDRRCGVNVNMLLTRREKNIMPEHNEQLGWWVIVPWRLGAVRQFTGWHMGCHDLFQAQGMRRRPMQALVSCSGGRTTACDPHALGGGVASSVAPTLRTAQQRINSLEEG